MAGNNEPIFSRVGDIMLGPNLLTAANDFTGVSPQNALVYKADATNGSYLQRLRFKAMGTNVATVARIFFNLGTAGHLASLLTTPVAATATPSGTGGTLLTAGANLYVLKIVAVDAQGSLSAVGAEALSGAVTGPTGSISWAFTAITGASSYRMYCGVGGAATENGYFTYSGASPWVQTAMPEGTGWTDGLPVATNNNFIGELGLPATTVSTTTPTGPDIDYMMNMALPPGAEIYVGLATTVAAGWQVNAVAGKY
jgi:hypothetical protein